MREAPARVRLFTASLLKCVILTSPLDRYRLIQKRAYDSGLLLFLVCPLYFSIARFITSLFLPFIFSCSDSYSACIEHES